METDGTGIDEATIERFWSKVERRGPDECWEWSASKATSGYGRFSISSTAKTAAHRFSLGLQTGIFPPSDVFALHSCDNRCCVNPAHLRWGSHHDNVSDAIERDRFHRWDGAREGQDNPFARLTNLQVEAVRADRRRQAVIAEEYGISVSHVSRIKIRKVRKHVARTPEVLEQARQIAARFMRSWSSATAAKGYLEGAFDGTDAMQTLIAALTPEPSHDR